MRSSTPWRHVRGLPRNRGGLNGSSQHLPEVYRLAFGIPVFLAVFDSSEERSCRDPTASIVTSQFLAGSTAAVADWCFRSFALPRAVGVAEIDFHVRCDSEALVARHLVTSVPG